MALVELHEQSTGMGTVRSQCEQLVENEISLHYLPWCFVVVLQSSLARCYGVGYGEVLVLQVATTAKMDMCSSCFAADTSAAAGMAPGRSSTTELSMELGCQTTYRDDDQ